MTDRLNGATLKTVLGGLGISPGWFACHSGCTMRTVVRWFDANEISPTVTEMVQEIEQLTVDEMLRMVQEAEEQRTEGDEYTPVKLRTYRTDQVYDEEMGAKKKLCVVCGKLHEVSLPASWHRQLTFRVLEHFRAQGVPVKVVYK